MKNNRKFRYGITATVYTLLVIAVIVVFNVIFTAVGDRFYSVFHPDISPEQLYEITSTTDDLFDLMMSDMSEQDRQKLNENKVTITFMMSETDISVSGIEKLREIYEMAKEYENRYDFIKLDFIEPDKNPELVQKFTLDSNRTDSSMITTTDVYFYGPSGQYLSVPYLRFYLTDESNANNEKYTLNNIESKMTGSIISLFSTDSICYIVKGHGEDTGLSGFRELLAIAGFTVVDVDLTKDTLDYEKGKLIVVNSPKKDFGGVNSPVNELKILGDFVSYSKVPHHMMTFVDSEYATNGNLSEFLAFMEDFGFYYNVNVVTESGKNLNGDGKVIDGTFVSSDTSTDNSGGMGYSFIENLSDYKAVIKNACTIRLSATNSSSVRDEHFVDSIITTSGSGRATDLDTGDSYDATYATLVGIYGHEMIVDSKTYYTSYVLSGGSSSFISDEYLKVYANKDIIFSALRTMALNSVDPLAQKISYKEYYATGLTMTGSEQVIWIVLMSAFIPVMIMAAGIVIFVRRRNS